MKRAHVIPPRHTRKKYLLECFYGDRCVIEALIPSRDSADLLKRMWESGSTQAEIAERIRSMGIKL